MARRAVKTGAIVVPETSFFGWCMTGHHKDCPKEIVHWQPENEKPTTCRCACHTSSTSTSKGKKP